MHCADVQKFVYVFLDGEFDAREQVEFEQHLVQCARCRQQVQGERGFRNVLQESLRSRPARMPASLSAAIRTRLRDAEPAREPLAWRRLAWTAGPLLAVAATLLLMVATRDPLSDGQAGLPTATSMEPLIDQAAIAHHRDLPTEVQGTPAAIVDQLNRKVAFRVTPPLPDTAETQLLGARVVQVAGQPGILFQYRHKGSKVSVMQMADGSLQPAPGGFSPTSGAPAKLTAARGYNVALFSDHGLTNSVVTDLEPGELMRLLPASYRR